MKFPSRRPTLAPPQSGVTGTARVDRRTSALLPRLRPGDIAVVDHLDLDRSTAQALVDRGVRGVVNAAPAISGRYPNLGPEILVEAGVLLVDDVGVEVLSRVKDGARVRIDGGSVYVGESPVASGRLLGPDDVLSLMEDARQGVATQLQSFTHNTTEFLRRDPGLLLHGHGVPELATRIQGRPVVVVVHGFDYRDDLRRLKPFIREQKPVLVGVDSGADALLEAGYRPDIVVVGEQGLGGSGDGHSRVVSDKALRHAREVVLHADRSGRVVGADRLERVGVRAKEVAANGLSEDVALLVADSRGASVIVTVGTHATLDEFLDRHRAGLAGTFLTRLRVGPKLVDARGVPQLYAGRVRTWHLALLVLAGLIAVLAAVVTTPVGQDWWDRLVDWIQGLET
jgi:uncharacterized membrane-anchored protein